MVIDKKGNMFEQVGAPFAAWRNKRCVESAAFSQDGSLLVAVSSRLTGNIWDGQLRLFALGDNAKTAFPDPSAPEKEADIIKSGCAAPLLTSLTDVAWITDAKTVATSADDGSIHIYSIDEVSGLKEFCSQRTLVDHDDVVSSLSFNRDSRMLASASFDGTVKVWDVSKPKSPASTLSLDNYADTFVAPLVWDVVHCGLNTGAPTLASAHQDGRVRLWDPRAHSAPVSSVRYSDRSGACLCLSDVTFGGHYVAAGFESGAVEILDIRAGFLKEQRVRHAAAVHRVAVFSSPGEGSPYVVSAGDDGMVFATAPKLDAQPEELTKHGVPDARSHEDYVRALAVRPRADRSQQHVLTGGWDGVMKLHKWEQDKVITV